MTPDKRNVFLDADDSEDGGDQEYDSEINELRKGSSHSRSAKRRKLEGGESESDDDESEAEAKNSGDNEEAPRSTEGPRRIPRIDAVTQPREQESAPNTQKDQAKDERSKPLPKELPGVSKPLTKKSLIKTDAAAKKSGVVYISRVPPYMKPNKLRSLLSPYGQLNRIFLAPEDPAAYSRRKRGGGNTKRSFTEGWIEWCDKAEAKRAVDLLNARPIGGKKGSYYRDDIWSLLYLKNFKWRDLTAQIAAENAERASRVRAEISQTAKENKEFVRNVERAKMLEGMESKKAAKRRRDDEPENDDGGRDDIGGDGEELPRQKKQLRTFKQIPLAKKKGDGEQPEQVRRVLSKIF